MWPSGSTQRRRRWIRSLIASATIVGGCIAPALGLAQNASCGGVILADGSCAAVPPLFDPPHAIESSFAGGATATSADAGAAINVTNLRDGAAFDIPTGSLPSPLFGAQPFTQRLLLFEELGTRPLPTATSPGISFPAPPDAHSVPDGTTLDTFLAQDIFPFPTRLANTLATNPWQARIQTFLGRPLTHPPAEGRPPGEGWAHQRWTEFLPKVYTLTAQTGARTNRGLRDRWQRHGYARGEFGPGGLYHNTTGAPGFDGTTAGIPVRFHPAMPVQDPLAFWTFDGTVPPKLLLARYGEPVLVRHYNALPIDPGANLGFGLHTLTTHEHNGHSPAESDGFTQAFFFPGQFYDYRWPLALAGHDSINTTASDPRAGTPDDQGGITRIPGNWRETMSTHWFHDHMLDFTAQNVFKGNAAMMNYYSAVDRGREPGSAAEAAGNPATPGYGCHYANPSNVNLCLPSGSTLDWGNRDYDVNLVLADKAWDADGQLFFNIFNLDGFLGDQMTVNFVWKPTFEVRARRYRFRVLNGAVSRYVKLALVTEAGAPVPLYMVANDGNLMEHTVFFPDGQLPEQASAERYDFVVDFAAFAPGTRLYLVNLLEHRSGRRPHEIIPLADVLSGAYQAVRDGGRWVNGDPVVGKFLEFRVVAYAGVDRSMNPADYVPGRKTMIPLPVITQAELDGALHRTFEFGRASGTDQAPWTVKTDGGQGIAMDPRRVSAAPRRGALEIWHIVNGGNGWSHPVHIHFEEGRILRRGGQPPPRWEVGARKDMYRIGPLPDSGDSVEVAVRFREFLGTYMEHCHNTQHEDHSMLLRWDIEHPGQVVVMPTPMPTWDGVTFVDSVALPTFRTGDPNAADNARCGDGRRNQPLEQCDGADAAACPGACRADCTCPGPASCGDGLVNQPSEDCDGVDDAACPGACQADCLCAVLPVCGDGRVNHADEQCDAPDAVACPGACRADCTCPPPVASVEADVSLVSTSPTTRFGGASRLEVDASAAKQTFLRVRVTGVGGRTVTSARLRLQAQSDAGAASDSGGRIHPIATCGWNESTLTWNTRPPIDGPVLDTIGPVAANESVAFDVTGAIPGDGVFCFALDSLSANGVDYRSREAGSGGPRLDLVVAGSGAPPSPTTTTTRPPSTTTRTTTTSTTTTLSGGTVLAQVLADAAVRSDASTTNLGTRTLMGADAGTAVERSFLRVQVSGVGARPVSSATLRLRVADVSNAESVSGGQLRLADCTWSETGVTFATQPGFAATVLDTKGAVARGQVVDFDLAGAIQGDGTFCFALTNPSTDGVDYSTREAASGRPALIVRTP